MHRPVPSRERTTVLEEPTAATFLFTDIEGSTRLWEQQPERMQHALAWHDQMARDAVTGHGGEIVKTTGDGIHAVFDDAADALRAVLSLQLALLPAQAELGIPLNVRCGLHAGAHQRRDNDFYGTEVNRAARVMSVAHGGQVLLSKAVVDRAAGALPEGAALRDLGKVRLRDLTSPEHVYQLLHPQLRADFPPLRSLEATPNNLAQQLNSFVGRAREVAEVKAMLDANRLVTLLGMGGIGKSRLSVQLGAEVMDSFADGVWLVELAPLSDPQLVPQAVASVLGVKEEAGRPVVDALVKFVRDRELLVILDNCEHLVQACAELAKQLLQAGPHLKVLASSRDPLQIAGETAYHVPTLSAPDPNKPVTLADLTRHEAVRLFIDRATAAQPAFRVTEKNAPAVADICHRLDGIPLAIELAAARTRALSVEVISARLNDRFRLLVTGDKTVLPRQRTLRALIDWSYDLLPPNERALFQRLSVFAGGWTLEAVEAVGAGGEVAQPDVMDLLTHLVEKSLVVMEVGGERYRMLDTVRQYAKERMSESGDEVANCNRHLSFFLGYAETARPELAGPEQGSWLGRLDLERENFLSAHAWGEGLPNAGELGLRMAHALRPYWIYRGLLSLGLRLSVEVLSRRGMWERNDSRCQALAGAGQMCFFMGLHGEARTHLSESLSIARETGNRKWAAAVLQPLGMACMGQGDSTAAKVHLQEAVNLARELGNKRELAAALNGLANFHRSAGDLDAVAPLYETALSIARELDDRSNIAITLLNLSMVSVAQSRLGATRQMLLEVLSIAAETGSVPVAQSALDVCAGLAATRTDWLNAAHFYGMSAALIEQTGLRREPADEEFLSPLVSRSRTALGQETFAAAEQAGFTLTSKEALTQARDWLNQ
jgi:predicted ATPase/class 3 adenylate cyclase